MCDLFRLGAPALYKLRGAFDFAPEQHDFLRHLQRELLRHAMSLAAVIYEAGRHGGRMLADTWLPTITYDSSRIMLYHVTQLIDPAVEDPQLLVQEITPLLRQNIDSLRLMQPLHAVAGPLTAAAERMLSKASDPKIFHTPIAPESEAPEQAVEESPPGTPPQAAPDYVLNPLTIYRMARNTIAEKHAPEKIAHSPSTGAGSFTYSAVGSPDSPRSRRQQSQQGIDAGQPSTNHGPGPPSAYLQSISAQLAAGPTHNRPDAMDAELQSLFTSELGWTWQNAETLGYGGMIGDDGVLGLLPWAPTQFQTNFETANDGGFGDNAICWPAGHNF